MAITTKSSSVSTDELKIADKAISSTRASVDFLKSKIKGSETSDNEANGGETNNGEQGRSDIINSKEASEAVKTVADAAAEPIKIAADIALVGIAQGAAAAKAAGKTAVFAGKIAEGGAQSVIKVQSSGSVGAIKTAEDFGKTVGIKTYGDQAAAAEQPSRKPESDDAPSSVAAASAAVPLGAEMLKKQVYTQALSRGAISHAVSFKTVFAALSAAVNSAVASTVSAASSSVALIGAAAGAVAAPVVCFMLIISTLITSPLGILFSDEANDESLSIASVVAQINDDFTAAVNAYKSKYDYDEVVVCARASWKQILAVYAVKFSSDPDNPFAAIIVDESTYGLISEIFWEMNTLSAWLDDEIETETLDDGTANVSVTTTLTVWVSIKTADEMADYYSFTSEQREILAELLDDKYNSFRMQVLYGVAYDNSDIVSVARAQLEIGEVGGETYWSWFGFHSRIEWCACFVSWCANECGYVEAGLAPKSTYCDGMITFFKKRGLYFTASSGYTPNPGDIIFYDWDGDGTGNHTGIVEYVKGDYVYTIEGNSTGDMVRACHRKLTSSAIMGYGVIAEF